ncbi:alpha-D-ribose 1-methylphosphonate 5-triphosphate synthase subunit PhnH [Paludibacterium purpuratum]|uniref:Alpha-D-ribose 1-methylphosphonate 5-triphosphate synthase subunit PhnH n=2 Tax=Paludibacterium purpuratum TaxID=1144873 RepID=A0A4R7BGU5_9NEIS|nr:alpha-D-ribose 1-methylphosphonate 5-triphosphate synthase subunit PhnH [Paludibacterium purpuratum]
MLHPAFKHPVDDAQQTFRSLLDALAQPLRLSALPCLPPALPGLSRGSAALLYTLIDRDVSLWLPSLPDDTLASLRFHTGMNLAANPAEADFLLLTAGTPLPPLSTLKAGSDAYPDRSATLLIEIEAFNQDQVIGSGPGIPHTRRFGADGLPGDFWHQWQANHARFPLGVDAILIADDRIAGLPRTTRIQEG